MPLKRLAQQHAAKIVSQDRPLTYGVYTRFGPGVIALSGHVTRCKNIVVVHRLQGIPDGKKSRLISLQTAGGYLQHSAQAKGEADTLQEKYEKSRDKYANG